MKDIDIRERISALRNAMDRNGLDAYIIPGSDPHLSEYVPARWRSRQWISGFTGSAGTIVVTAGKAGLWTDSRYFLQAESQLKDTGIDLYKILPGLPSLQEFLLHELSEGSTVGLDGGSYSVAEMRLLEKALRPKKILLHTSQDLVDDLWEDRPAIPGDQLFELPVEIAGQSVPDKLAAILQRLRETGADGLLLGALDEIAWTFNIRGNDVAYNPVVVSYAFVSENETVLFVQPGKLTQKTGERLKKAGVVLADYWKVIHYISQLPEGKKTIFLDPAKTNVALFNAIPEGCEIVEGITPVNMLKSLKNEMEITGFRNALVRDGVALTRFYRWLENRLAAGEEVTEMRATEQLSAFRAEQPRYISDSFHTICGYAAHGAIVHYGATPETDVVLRPEGFLLMDSGAQYLDGTTDITRTVALGEPTEVMMDDYTRVLKGHIGLAMSRFPDGTRGSQLDILARKALWDAGLNYLHGTGHGIGHCLNVHEGPQNIRMEENPVKLQEGMVLSNEPGIYRTDKYGIRIENMIVVRPDCQTEYGKFLSFETLTMCYVDTRPVIVSMLSAGERAWLNQYHWLVYEKLSPFLTGEEKEWMKEKTQAI
jgi:Xaa-Pro aminopeptidase